MSTTDTRTSDVKSLIAEYKAKFDGIGEDGAFKKSVEELMWLHQALTSFREKVVAEERERIVDAMHERYPVPDMNMAEVWPKDEQVRWAGIGEVMVYLQELTKRNI